MTEKRKKIIAGGLLVIIIAAVAVALRERAAPSIGWMMAGCSAWTLGVWLFPRVAISARWMLGPRMRMVYKISIIAALAFLAVAIGAERAVKKWRIDDERLRLQAEHAAAMDLAMAAKWYVDPAEKIYAEVKALRAWKADFIKAGQSAIWGEGRFGGPAYDKWSEAMREAEKRMPEQVEAFLRLPFDESLHLSYEEVVQRYRASQDHYQRTKQ